MVNFIEVGLLLKGSNIFWIIKLNKGVVYGSLKTVISKTVNVDVDCPDIGLYPETPAINWTVFSIPCNPKPLIVWFKNSITMLSPTKRGVVKSMLTVKLVRACT